MKTKEQAAKEYANTRSKSDIWREEIARDFLSGIEFAESWISVEDELPDENYSEQVLCKQSGGDYRLIVGRKVKNWVIGYINTDGAITHWRPINRN